MAACFHIGNKVVYKTPSNSWGFNIMNIDGSDVDEVGIGELHRIRRVLLSQYRMISEASEIAALVKKVLDEATVQREIEESSVNKIDAKTLIELSAYHKTALGVFEMHVKARVKELNTEFVHLLLEQRFPTQSQPNRVPLSVLSATAHPQLLEQAEKLFLREELCVFPFNTPGTTNPYAALMWQQQPDRFGNQALLLDGQTYKRTKSQYAFPETLEGGKDSVRGFPTMALALNAMLNRWW